MNKQRFEEWVQRLNALRVRMSDAEVDFWDGVMSFEADESAWGRESGTGYATFEEALHVAGVKSPYEYGKFKRCVQKLGSVTAVRSIGFAAAKELLDVPDDAPSRVEPSVPAVKAAFDGLVMFREKWGKEPSGQTGAAKVREHYLPPPKQAEPKTENAFDIMKKKLKAAEKRADVAEKRVAVLEKENAELRERLGDTKCPRTARRPRKQGRSLPRAEA